MNNQRYWMKSVVALVVLAGPTLWPTTVPADEAPAGDRPADRPNILWIVSEDNGPFLGCYGDKHARTPCLDKLAADGVLFRNAFSNAPVCAPSRCTIITGMYASTLGTQHMRSTYAVPESIVRFPQYLRDAGYYCINPGKTDYNLTGGSGGWDKGKDWSGRKPGQPFFCVLNNGTSHESALHKTVVNPDYLKEPFALPPYHPDTPEIRSNWVEYYHIITRMDAQMGAILDRLETDGLADDTIVFYYSDHAGILPRSKRFLYDSGVHVPLIMRFPKKYRHLAPGAPGSKTDRLVNLIDLGPTVLSLAGVKIPEHMQGQSFLGLQQGKPRAYVYGIRDRMDERYDMMRSARDERYKYIRNYYPHRIYGERHQYLWKMPATRSWEQAFRAGKCNAVQSDFWKIKPTEELYDTQADPHEIHNLAGSLEHKDILDRMRKVLHAHLLETRDSAFLPESEMLERAKGSTIYQMAQDKKRYPLERILPMAELAGQRDAEGVPALIEGMKDKEPGVRYWAALGCAVRGGQAQAAGPVLQTLLKDEKPCVRVLAAEALCRQGQADLGLPVLVDLLAPPNKSDDILLSLNALLSLGKIALPVADAVADKAPKGDTYTGHAAQSLLEMLKE